MKKQHYEKNNTNVSVAVWASPNGSD